MSRIIGYKIINGNGLKDLEQNVNEYILEGWVPLGAPFKEAYYHQAMVVYS
jgi:hypothetical protein